MAARTPSFTTSCRGLASRRSLSIRTIPRTSPRAIDDKTRALFCETVSNPALEITDLEAVAKVAHDHGIPLIVDATFSTPYLTQPLQHGADIVVHSLTKWFGGHGTGIGGVVVDSGKFPWAAGKHPLYTTPDTSYHGLRWGIDLPDVSAAAGLHPADADRTAAQPRCLHLSGQLVDVPSGHRDLAPEDGAALRECPGRRDLPEVAPEGGAGCGSRAWKTTPCSPSTGNTSAARGSSMVVFGIKGGKESGPRFIEALRLFSHLANVGDAKSLAIHPATTTHSQLDEQQQREAGITPELVRLSVGIEHIDDILADLDQALRATA